MVVDDETGLAAAIETFLRRQGVEARSFGTAEAGLAALGELAPDVALVDLQLPGMDGLAALAAIRRERPETVVIVMTAYSSVQGAVTAMKQGAFDYVAKPLDLEELWLVIQRAWDAARARGELAYLRQRAGHTAPVASLLGVSAAMEAVRQRILQVAAADRLGDAGPTVLVTGETGTGKELAARAIHAAGPRASGPFVEINCAAIPNALLEGELFGFEKGAYTDARTSKPGLFEAADGGTFLLDEIGLLDVTLQAKLLKAIEDRSVRRLGALTPRRVDVRILAATIAISSQRCEQERSVPTSSTGCASSRWRCRRSGVGRRTSGSSPSTPSSASANGTASPRRGGLRPRATLWWPTRGPATCAS